MPFKHDAAADTRWCCDPSSTPRPAVGELLSAWSCRGGHPGIDATEIETRNLFHLSMSCEVAGLDLRGEAANPTPPTVDKMPYLRKDAR